MGPWISKGREGTAYAYDAAKRLISVGDTAMTYDPTGALSLFGARRVGEVVGRGHGQGGGLLPRHRHDHLLTPLAEFLR